MSQASIEQSSPALLEEWRRFREWAGESMSISPFVYLAMHWHAGHLTIEEGRRIEREQQLAAFLRK